MAYFGHSDKLTPIIIFAPNEEEFEVGKILDPWVSYGHVTFTKSIQPLVWMMSKNNQFYHQIGN